MEIKYLWDTNIVIYHLQKLLPPSAEKYIDQFLDLHEPVISVISELELLCWITPAEKDSSLLQEFLKHVQIIELNKAIKVKAADIRKKYRLKLPDAVIASTAVLNNLTLITRNSSDFSRIEELQILNPYQEERNQ